ncbi:hypothetical protein [Pseudomonas alabamensis]|uniref:hypothetical protein n=1 Tax=Pseudomonas alabamensis TaxID=3064349 RepID=UPI0021D8DEAE|nr:hypothetical protein [Pseudomonas entomophila]
MDNTSGMAIYGIERNNPEYIFEVGVLFFEIIGVSITASGYYKYREDRSEEDLDFIEVSLDDLRAAIRSGDATSFRIFHENKNGYLWGASFGYSTKDFGGFYHIDAQGYSSCLTQEKFIDYIDQLCTSGSMDYATFYYTGDVSEAMDYAAGQNLVKLYNFESPSLFNRETGGRFQGLERYRNEKLRMVYPVNIINDAHLEIKVGARCLREWILSEASHGSLERMTGNLWVWIVCGKSLDLVNNELGLNGVLVSWKPPRSNKLSKKIP